MTVAIGEKAPDFNLPADGGEMVSLTALQGKKVLLYFYPKDDTPGCTKQACDLRDNLPEFKKLGTRVIGISRDSVKKHDKFKQKYGLNFTLVADEDGKTCEDYGVWVQKSMYGKKYMGIERTSFLIDETGRISHIWNKVNVDKHLGDVIAALKET